MKKRVFAVLLTLIIAATLLTVSAMADGDVAEITTGEQTTTYSTPEAFKDAVSALSGEAEIKLLQDIFIPGSRVTQQKLTIPADATVTLDLNGKTLSVAYMVEIKGDLTVKDGSTSGDGKIVSTATSTASSYAPINVKSSGNLTFESGTVTGSDGGYALSVSSSAEAEISGGTWSGSISAAANDLAITGGNFTYDISPYVEVNKKVVLTDGYYSINGTLTETDAAAKIDGNYYASVVSALKNATEGSTVTVLKNTYESGAVIVSANNVTLDLNGNTVNMGGNKLTVSSSGSLTIKCNAFGEGKIEGTASQLISVAGTLVLESGSIEADSTAVYTQKNSTFKMTGGTVEGAPAVNVYGGTVEITGGSVTAGDDMAVKTGKYAQTITVGTKDSGNYTLPYVDGITLANSLKVQLYSGFISDIEGTIGSDSVLAAHFGADISEALPAGYICSKVGEYYVAETLTVENAEAKIGEEPYASVASACEALEANETLTLLKDISVSGTSPAISIDVTGATLDLNGHSITCTSTTDSASEAYGVYVKCTSAGTFKIVNTSETEAVITGYNAAVYVTTNESRKVIEVTLEGDINLAATKSDASTVELGYAALVYSEDAASAVSNGGFKATTAEGDFIYGTAAAAMSAATDHTATMLNDYNGSSGIALSGEGMTGILDLDGHTYTTTSNDAIAANAAGVNLTVKNGTVVSTSTGTSANPPAGASIGYGSADNTYDNASITLENVMLTLTNPGQGVVVSGNNERNEIIIRNSTITVPSTGIGVYFPSENGTLTIEDSSITAGTGVTVKGGTATISGDSVIHATGKRVDPEEPNTNGSIDTGAAVYLEGNYGWPVTVNITGGSFASDNGEAVQLLFEDNSTGEKTINITGGYFTTNPSEYVAGNLYVIASDKDGYTYMVSGTQPETAQVIVTDETKGEVSDGIDEDDAIKIEAVMGDTSVSGVAEAVTSSGKNAIIVAAGAQTGDNALVEIEITVSVEATSAELTGDNATVTYEVNPVAIVKVNNVQSGNDIPVSNSYLSGAPITVRLPLPAGLTPAEVMHIADNGARERFLRGEFVVGDGYVEVKISHFSTLIVNASVTKAVQIGSATYGTLEEAVAAAEDGDTIKLLMDCSEPVTISKKSVTIDLNSHSYDADLVTVGDNSYKYVEGDKIVVIYRDPTDAPNVPDTYPITVDDAANGTVDVSYHNASKGSVITITATPDAGYVVGSVKVTGPDGSVDVKRVNATTYTFTMPDGAVEVSVSFVPASISFTDVNSGDWFYDYVRYVVANGLMEGTSATTFEPNAIMTRAMVWTILARIDGETITGTSWQSDARAWAMENGVSDGTDPNGLVTREQFATMLYRYAGEPAVSGGLSAYTDAASVSEWATDAMLWATKNGIITGVTATTLDPQGTTTRAQCAAMLMRFAEL